MLFWSALALVGSAVIVVAIVLAVRRYVAPPDGFFADPVPAASVFGVLGVAFAVLLAFVVFLAFEGYARALDGASREAVAVTQLVRVTRLFPDAPGQELRGDVACYARAVVADEWPAMASGKESDLVVDWVARIESTVDGIEVDTGRTEVALSQWLDETATRREGRRSRLTQGMPMVPEAVWLTLLVGAGVTLSYLVLYADRRDKWWVQAAMSGSVAMVVVAGLLVVVFLDRPFQQDGAYISPHEMRTSIRLMDEDFAGDLAIDAPCDEAGASCHDVLRLRGLSPQRVAYLRPPSPCRRASPPFDRKTDSDDPSTTVASSAPMRMPYRHRPSEPGPHRSRCPRG